MTKTMTAHALAVTNVRSSYPQSWAVSCRFHISGYVEAWFPCHRVWLNMGDAPMYGHLNGEVVIIIHGILA